MAKVGNTESLTIFFCLQEDHSFLRIFNFEPKLRLPSLNKKTLAWNPSFWLVIELLDTPWIRLFYVSMLQYYCSIMVLLFLRKSPLISTFSEAFIEVHRSQEWDCTCVYFTHLSFCISEMYCNGLYYCHFKSSIFEKNMSFMLLPAYLKEHWYYSGLICIFKMVFLVQIESFDNYQQGKFSLSLVWEVSKY